METGQKILVGLLMAGSLIYLLQRRNFAVLAASNFYRPDLVQEIANKLPNDRDAFILAAWHYVATAFPYEDIGSEMSFQNGYIECVDCYLPNQTLDREEGNCVAKSSLLASILVTKLPASTVHIIIGHYTDRVSGGHAWVEIYRDNAWYLLDATKTPDFNNPWKLADLSFPQYDPGVLITNDSITVEDPAYGVISANCNCGNIASEAKVSRRFGLK